MNHAETIINLSAEHFGIPVELLSAKTRKREVVVCRMSAMAMLKEFTQLSLKTIGRHFGGRDHATVIHALETVENMEDQDIRFADKLYVLKELVMQKLYPTHHINQAKGEQIDKEFEHLI